MMKHWTKKEIKFLQDNCKTMTYSEIAKVIKRTPNAVCERAKQIDAKCITEQDRAIYALYKGEELRATGTINEIAKELGILRKTVLFYGTPTYKKRKTQTVLMKLED